MRGASLLLALLLATATPLEAHANARRLAVVVGVDHFDDPAWPDLRWAAKDAKNVEAALAEFDQVIRPGRSGRVTRADVLDALVALGRSNTSADDTLVVYLSTHGALDRDGRGALRRILLLSDTRSEALAATGLPYEDLMAALDALPARRSLVVIAACHAGAGKAVIPDGLARELRGLKGPFFPVPEASRSEGRVVLTASGWGEPAREDDRLENDIYTHFLVEALLEGRDRDGDGAVTALEAHDAARARTLAYTGGAQSPTLTAEIVGLDPVVLVGRRSSLGRPVVAGYGRHFDGARLEIDGREKAVLPGGVPITPGLHRVRVLRADETVPLLDARVEARPGGAILLDALAPAPTPAWELAAGWRSVLGGPVPAHPGLRVAFAPRGSRGAWRFGFAADLAGVLDARVGSGAPPERRTLLWVRPTATVSRTVLRRGRLEVGLQAEAGWTLGWYRIDLGDASGDDLLSFPAAALHTELVWWLGPRFGVVADLAAEGLAAPVEAEVRLLPALRFGIGLRTGG